MPGLAQALATCRQSYALHLLLWCLIALGIVPAIVTESIIPFDIFGLQFGLESNRVEPPPRAFSLSILCAGALLCLLTKRFMHLILLLPWLALVAFGLDQLSARLPTYSAVQAELRKQQDQAREDDVTSAALRDKLARIRYRNDDLPALDKAAIGIELDAIDATLAKADDNFERQINDLSAKLKRKAREIREFDRATKGFLKSQQRLIAKLKRNPSQKALLIITQTLIRPFIVKRNRLLRAHAELQAKLENVIQSQQQVGDTYARLFALQAAINTHLWISDSYRTWYYTLPYKLLCLSILLLMLYRFSLGSWILLFTLAASLLVSILFVEAPLSFCLWLVLKFFIFTLIVKAIYLAVAENLPLIRDQARGFLLQTLARTFKYYSPFILLIIAGFVTTHYADNFVDDQLYALVMVTNSDPSRNTRRYDIDIAVDDYFHRFELEAMVKLDRLAKTAGNEPAAIARGTVEIFADTFKPELPDMNPAFKEPRCDVFYHWLTRTGKCAEKEVKRPLNDTYSDSREEQYEILDETMTEFADKTGNTGRAAVLFAKHQLRQRIDAVRLALKTQLRHIYFAIDFYTWISLLVLIVVILKSFLYIFARIFFASGDASETFDGKRAIQFKPMAIPRQQGSVAEVANTLKLTAKLGAYLYVNKEYDFANAPPDETTPQPGKAFFSRFKNRVWHMNKIKSAPRANARDVPYRRIPDNERIIVWTLKPGDEVIFSWKTFVGMSDVIGIRTRYSWQLSSLIFGRMFFVVASVDPAAARDGTLLLAAKGHDGVRKMASPANSPDQLLAWQTTSRFQLLANLNFRNIYRSGIQIRAQKSDLAVMHLSDDKRRRGGAAFLKYFVLPA